MHEQWLAVAEELASNCIDPYVKIGCVLVKDNKKISEGWNRVPKGVEEIESRHSHRPAMFYWVEHAERIAVFEAARNGVCTAGATAYVNVAPEFVCTHCLRGFIEGGITCVVGNTRKLESIGRTVLHDDVNRIMYKESGIETITIDIDLKL